MEFKCNLKWDLEMGSRMSIEMHKNIEDKKSETKIVK